VKINSDTPQSETNRTICLRLCR